MNIEVKNIASNNLESPLTKKDFLEFMVIFREDLMVDITKEFDDFAIIVNNSFLAQKEYMDERFEEAERINNSQFEEIDRRFDGVDGRIREVNSRLDHMATYYSRHDEYEKLEKRVTKLETASI